MNKLSRIVIVSGAFAVLAGALAFAVPDGQAAGSDGFAIAVDKQGSIRVPAVDYRKDWTSLGPWAVAAEEGKAGSQGIHAVYTQPESVAAYRKNGKFPDGTVLIKELFSTVTEDMTTGTVSRADKTVGWFVMVKDSTGRFPGNKLWGDGWGWAFFEGTDRVNTTSTDYVADCKGCHVPVQDSDWVYVQGYPVLRGE